MPETNKRTAANRNTAKRPTLKDIAVKANVSTATVSQALNPRPESNINLPKDTVERVRTVARELNYRPHAGARSIRTNRFQNLGLFVAKMGPYTHLPDGYAAGLHDSAEKYGYRLTLIRLPQSIDDVEVRVPSIFDEHNLDALVIASYHSVTKQIHERLSQEKLPVIYLNDFHQDNAVYVDDLAGSEEMTRHLVSQGYRKICYTYRKPTHNPPIEQMHYSAQQRLQGYLNVMQQAGLEPHVSTFYAKEVLDHEEPFPSGWWEQVKDAEVIFAYDDELANRIARFLYQKNIKVPDDIGLAGYNGDYAALSSWCRLTTMMVPAYEMGKAAFDIAYDLVSSPGKLKTPSRGFKPSLLVGESTK